jgi:hypothetical protein
MDLVLGPRSQLLAPRSQLLAPRAPPPPVPLGRRRHPNADEREQALRVASRWIEPELMKRAFGWDVHKVGY